MALNVALVAFHKVFHYRMVMGGFTAVGSVPLAEDIMNNKITVFTPELKEAMKTGVKVGGNLHSEMAFYGRLDVDNKYRRLAGPSPVVSLR